MNHSHPKTTKRPFGAERPFPWKCHHCFKNQVVMRTVSYDAEFRHDGRLHTFTVPALKIPVCEACGEKVFTEEVDDQITDELRSHLHLLSPAEMRAGLDRLDMTQKEAAERLGIAEATLSRWLTDTQIQSRALDNLVRVFFAFSAVRDALRGESNDPELAHSDDKLDAAEVRKCARCGSTNLESNRREVEFDYGGREKPFRVKATFPFVTCRECGLQSVEGIDEDLQHDAACRHLGVMTPSEIVALREKIGLTQKELAELTGLGIASVSRWERGLLIQNDACDQLLYLLTFPENVRRLRQRRAPVPAEHSSPCEPTPVDSASSMPVNRCARYLNAKDAQALAHAPFDLHCGLN